MGLDNLLVAGVTALAGAVLLLTGVASGIGIKLLLTGLLTLASTVLGGHAGRGGLNRSPTYGADYLSNEAQEGAPIPVVYGTHLVHPARISTNIKSSGDAQVLYLLYSIGEGEIASITDVRLNGTPIASLPGCSYETRMGTASQETVKDFDQVGFGTSHSTLLSGATASAAAGAHTYVMADEADEIAFGLTAHGGIWKVNDDGAPDSTSAIVKLEYKAWDAADSVPWATLDPTTTEKATWEQYENVAGTWRTWGKTQSPVRRQIRISLDGSTGRPARGRYKFRLTGAHPDKSTHTRTFTVTTILELVNDARTYANEALLALKVQMSEQISGQIPRVSCVVGGRKVYDPRTGVTALSSNPGVCARDFILNTRYGLGNWLASTDLHDGASQTWRDAMDYYDTTVVPVTDTLGAGTAEKRHELDFVMDVKAPANEQLSQMFAGARSSLYPAEGKIRVAVDKALVGGTARSFEGRVAAAAANRRNILDTEDGEGGRRSTLVARRLSANERSTTVTVRYKNRAKGWRDYTLRILDKYVNVGAITDGPYVAGEKIVGATSGARGRVTFSAATGTPYLTYVQDDDATAFASGETITGEASGATCTTSSAPYEKTPERPLEMQLFGVTRRSQILRESRYHLNRAHRTPLFASWGVFLGDLDVLPGDVVDVSADFFAWTNKKFTTLATGFDAEGRGAVEAREYDADVYADNVDTTLTDIGSWKPGGEDIATAEPAPPGDFYDPAVAAAADVPFGSTTTTTSPPSAPPPAASPPPAATPAPTTGGGKNLKVTIPAAWTRGSFGRR